MGELTRLLTPHQQDHTSIYSPPTHPLSSHTSSPFSQVEWANRCQNIWTMMQNSNHLAAGVGDLRLTDLHPSTCLPPCPALKIAVTQSPSSLTSPHSLQATPLSQHTLLLGLDTIRLIGGTLVPVLTFGSNSPRWARVGLVGAAHLPCACLASTGPLRSPMRTHRP